jgi:4-aminobutyrate aminotransferase
MAKDDFPTMPKITTPPPGPHAKEIVARDAREMATTTKSQPLAIRRGRGCIAQDVDGNFYLDFAAGVGALNTGHAHPRVVEAIRRQAGEFIHFAGTDYYYAQQADLAKRLNAIAPINGGRAKTFFTNSGTESNEAALKLVRHASKRPSVLAFLGAFHGRTMGSLSMTASKKVQREGYLPMLGAVEHIPFADCYHCPYKLEYPSCDLWCLHILEEEYFPSLIPPGDLAAVFAEPVQGEGGYVVPPLPYFKELKKILDPHGVLLVMDEVQSGIGRTGKWFASEHFGVKPDVVATAKALGSGVPIGAAVYRADLDWGVSGSHSNTFGGNPVACAAAMATIDVIEGEHLLANATRQGKLLRKRLEEVQEDHPRIGDVRGIGLMQAAEFVKDPRRRTRDPRLRDAVTDEAFRRGLVLLGCGRNTVRFIPPLVVSSQQVDKGVELFEQALTAAEKRVRA